MAQSEPNNQSPDNQMPGGGLGGALTNELTTQGDPILTNAFADLDGGDGGAGSNPDGQHPQIKDPAPQQKSKFDDGFKDADERAAHFQSLFNKTEAQLKQMNEQLEPIKGKASLFDQFVQNPELRRALISKYEPDLFRKPEPDAYVQTKLKEKYGEDYVEKFNKDEIGVPGTFSWTVNLEAAKLYQEATSDSGMPKTVEDVFNQMEQENKLAQEKFENEKRSIMEKHNMTEDGFKRFMSWANNLNMDNLAFVYSKGVQRLSGQQISPNISEIPGFNRPPMSNEQRKMFEDFGYPEQPFSPSILQ